MIGLVAAKKSRRVDEPVAWYCVMRLKELIEHGIQQKKIAEDSGLTPAAINHLVRNAQGAGATTVTALAEYLGFRTRGGLVDAADEWWAKEGKQFAIDTLRGAQRERERELKSMPEKAPESARPVRKRHAAG